MEFLLSDASTGIIGGADGPTAVFLFQRLLLPMLKVWLGLAVLVPIPAVVILRLAAPAFMKEHLSWKTSGASVALAVAGGAGLACFLFWLTLGLGGPSMYPIAYPASILGGLLALLAFAGLCALYAGLRRKQPSWQGVLVDVLTSILLLPLCAYFCMFLISLV